MNIIKNKDLYVFVLAGIRTGHHYIMEILSTNMDYNTRIDMSNPNAVKKNFADSSKKQGCSNDMYLFDREEPDYNMVKQIDNFKIENKFKILVIRDPFNNWASVKQLKKKLKCYNENTFKNWEKMYCDSIYLVENNLIDLVIIYDFFISRKSYRNDILSQFDIDIDNFKEVNNVTKDGWGSSFSDYKLDSVNELITRKNTLDNEDILKIENNEIINRFYKKYFT